MKPVNEYHFLLKVLVVGDSGVGKTCLIQRYCKDEFFTNYLSTIAIDFKLKRLKLNEHNVVL